MNNIAIKLEQIHFDKDTIEELNKFAKTYKMKVTYYYGYKEPYTIGSMKRYIKEYFSMIYKMNFK